MRQVVATFCFGLTLAACGQSEQPAPTPQPQSAAPPALSAEAIATAVAALPAPYAEGNYEAGRRVFAQCRSCHTLEAGGHNRVGPNLHAIIGRHVATGADFNYSDALRGADFSWDGARLEPWLENPQADIPGTRMAFAGVRNETQRRDLITYLMIETAR